MDNNKATGTYRTTNQKRSRCSKGLLAILFSLMVSVSFAEVSRASSAARMTENGDIASTTSVPRGATVTAIKVNPAITGSFYRLRVGSSTGNIVYEVYASSGTSGNSVAPLQADTVQFTFPSEGLYFETDDPSTTKSITVYTR